MHPRRYLTHPTLAGFTLVEDGPARTLVRRGLEPAAPLLGLRGDPPSPDSIAGGRAKHPLVPLPDGSRAVVRRYHRGGAVRHVNRATYFLGHRAFHELLATETARAAGVRVPLVLAATERRSILGYHAWLATRLLVGTTESAAWLASASPDARLPVLREAGRQVAWMHDAGIAHPDLNLRNLLVSVRASPSPESTEPTHSTGSTEPLGAFESTALLVPAARTTSTPPTGASRAHEPSVYLIDFDGATLFATPAPLAVRAANIRRLARSVRKLAAPVGASGWAAMADGYGAGWPLSAAETRDLG
jgi:3-deoxy-D-manno-octulosonic acid kinase